MSSGTVFSSSQRRKQDDERFNLSAQEYLERYHIPVYVSDSIRAILDAREERPLETALKYFNSVLQVNLAFLAKEVGTRPRAIWAINHCNSNCLYSKWYILPKRVTDAGKSCFTSRIRIHQPNATQSSCIRTPCC